MGHGDSSIYQAIYRQHRVKRKQRSRNQVLHYSKKMEQRQICKAKLAFIVSTAKPIEKFLKMYQTDSPMIPFLAKDLEDLLRIMMDRFVKQSVMEKATSTQKLCRMIVTDKDNHKTYQNTDIGFVADLEIKKLLTEKQVSETTILAFRTECKDFLCTFLYKIQAESNSIHIGWKFVIVRSISDMQ